MYSLFFLWNPELINYLFFYSPQPTPFSPTLFSPSPHSNLSPELGAWATRSPWQCERWSGAPKQRRPRLDYARMLELGATTADLSPGMAATSMQQHGIGSERAAAWAGGPQRSCCSLGARRGRHTSDRLRACHSAAAAARCRSSASSQGEREERCGRRG